MITFKLCFASLLIAALSVGCSQDKEVIVFSCSGKQSGINLVTLQYSESQFNGVILKIQKVKGQVTSFAVEDSELTKEPRATDPGSPNFLRWFEQNGDSIITYGKNAKDNKSPEWNIKLSSAGVFERKGYGVDQKGVCTAQKKAF